MIIRKANHTELEEIVSIILNSELGKRYFKTTNAGLYRVIEQGITKDQVYVTVENNELVGMFQVVEYGTFGKYPYIHFIVVAEHARGLGIGKNMMCYIKNELFDTTNKIFLLVGLWNERAIKFYSSIGYTSCCELSSFYNDNETELMMVLENQSSLNATV